MKDWTGKTPTADEWREILEKHARWLRGESGGVRANLGGANLGGANLDGANLDGANLGGANLGGANLGGANLGGANLGGANLYGANLGGANLVRASLYGANLYGANLYGANLYDANLYGANLDGANLDRANLDRANLDGANLDRASLYGASGADLVIARTRILPDGDLIGWKKCHDDVIVKLRVPAEAKRSHAWGRKCRAEFVDVLEVIGAEVGVTNQTMRGGTRVEYRAGQRVISDSWDDDWRHECSHGIHFYITRAEAEA